MYICIYYHIHTLIAFPVPQQNQSTLSRVRVFNGVKSVAHATGWLFILTRAREREQWDWVWEWEFEAYWRRSFATLRPTWPPPPNKMPLLPLYVAVSVLLVLVRCRFQAAEHSCVAQTFPYILIHFLPAMPRPLPSNSAQHKQATARRKVKFFFFVSFRPNSNPTPNTKANRFFSTTFSAQ